MNQIIGTDVGRYTFSSSNRTLTILDLPTFTLEQIVSVYNVTRGLTLYLPNDADTNATLVGNVLTFEINTERDMLDTDRMQVVIDLPSESLTDAELRTTPLSVTIAETQNVISDDDVYDISLAMDKSNNMPLYTEVSNVEKRDVAGAAIPSDAPVAINWTSYSVANTPITIDTTGYRSIVINKTTAGIITPTVSNDGAVWYATLGALGSTPYNPIANMPAALGVYIYPVTAKFFRLTGPATAVQCTIYLRNAPVNLASASNLAYIGATAVVHGGLAGTLAVGGNVATGVVPTTNPIQVGGVDAGRWITSGNIAANLTPKTRRALVDELGRFIPPMVDVNTGLSFENSLVAYTKDVSQHEGQSLLEIMNHILIELRLLNHQIHELPISIGAGTMNPSDDLEDLRTDMKEYNYDN